MSEDATRFDTVAAAEKALTDAGFTRNIGAAMWINGNVRAKVIRDSGSNKFVISQK